MGIAAAYPGIVLARQAQQWLVQHGIAARVMGELDALGGAGLASKGGGFGVTVDDALEPAARELLREWERMPPLAAADLEAQATPDLSRLDPRVLAPCPSCGERLPLDASVAHCPACAAPVSVTDVLLARHGPELLALCYEDTSEPLDGEAIDALDLRCPRCEYALRGLGRSGACPECGEPYTKQGIIQSRSGL
ncbi:MAG: hypothetical protein WD749_05405 [Phycisphaerales bacterium]